MANLAPPLPPTAFAAAAANPQNASAWYNLTAWTVNVTRYAPSLEDIVWAGPRIFMKLGSFIALPDHLGSSDSGYIPAPADANLLHPIAADTSLYNIMDVTSQPGGESDPVARASRLSVDSARGLGSVFSYATSKWALSCIAMAVILNRTHIFAATRRRLRFRWQTRLLLRVVPIVLLILQARGLLQSIQCQTSPDFALLRWGDASKSSDLMFSHTNGILNTLSSALLVGATDQQSCVAVHMVPPPSDSAQDLQGSLSRLWPLFGSFCLSHFVETVSCAVQGRPIASETGMTLFEQSLAFAEADGAVSNQLGWGSFTKTQSSDTMSSKLGSSIALTRSMILKRVNTPPEVLLVAFLSSMTHISSQVLGLFDLQAKYRLVNTGFWGLCFMGSIVWSAFTFDLDDPTSQGLLRFPTVCIIGFVPHVLVLAGIALCMSIYGFALLLSALAPPGRNQPSMTFRQRIAHAHQNMQANVSLSEIRLTREMDFYTALLRTGFASITMASEAVYLNEDRNVSLKQHTWLEEERFREAEELQRQWLGSGLSNNRQDQIGAIGLVPVKDGPIIASNGYGRERAAQKIPKGRAERGGLRVGIGATERSSRWFMAVEFLLSINKLLARLSAMFALGLLSLLRIRSKPAWLLWLARRPKSKNKDLAAGKDEDRRKRKAHLAFNDNGRIPRTDGIDVEAEFRRVSPREEEEDLDGELYQYWLKGGWWGSTDSSGDYLPDPVDDEWDRTSIITMSSRMGEMETDDSAWESEDSGQRTPTQQIPYGSHEGTPFVDSPLQMSDLARLLHPASKEERKEAETLSAHLQSGTIMTRSAFRRLEQLKRTRVLMSPGSGPASLRGFGRNVKLSPEEEERLLEEVLLSRRGTTPQPAGESASWQQGAAGLGGDGPQCVVCQSSPRTIIVWPCRCLSLCDECRVSLAMNNFDKCVCCRREVLSFSRIFVP